MDVDNVVSTQKRFLAILGVFDTEGVGPGSKNLDERDCTFDRI